MKRTDIIRRIADIMHRTAPTARVILYGSQARRDARPDSDWDILILVDKPRITRDDYDNLAYPLRELGWELDEIINPVLYTLKDWARNSFTPFYKNVMEEGVAL